MQKRCARCLAADRKVYGRRSESALLSREETARYLGVAPQTLAIWKWDGRYDLPVIKVGRLTKYRQSDLEAFLRRNTWTNGEAKR